MLTWLFGFVCGLFVGGFIAVVKWLISLPVRAVKGRDDEANG